MSRSMGRSSSLATKEEWRPKEVRAKNEKHLLAGAFKGFKSCRQLVGIECPGLG